MFSSFLLSLFPPPFFLAHTIRFERRAKNVEYFPNFPPLWNEKYISSTWRKCYIGNVIHSNSLQLNITI